MLMRKSAGVDLRGQRLEALILRRARTKLPPHPEEPAKRASRRMSSKVRERADLPLLKDMILSSDWASRLRHSDEVTAN
jgi:hypothetical protein